MNKILHNCRNLCSWRDKKIIKLFSIFPIVRVWFSGKIPVSFKTFMNIFMLNGTEPSKRKYVKRWFKDQVRRKKQFILLSPRYFFRIRLRGWNSIIYVGSTYLHSHIFHAPCTRNSIHIYVRIIIYGVDMQWFPSSTSTLSCC